MKYIRTKYGGIYKVINENKYDFVCEDNFGLMEGLNIHKSIVVKQADTIEELCDGIIVENKDYHHWF